MVGRAARAPEAETLMKILVVEDEEHIRRLLCRYLQKQGHTVETAGNGSEAWELIGPPQLTAYDVVFADIKMPVLDGRELLRRAQASGVDVRVVLVSGQVNVSVQDAREAGAFSIVHKPFDLDDIQAVLEDVESQL